MQPLLSRRAALATVPALALGWSLSKTSPARAQERYLDIRPGSAFRPITIAVTNFGGDAEQGAKLSGVVSNDFKRSTFIQPTDPSTFPEQSVDPDAPNLTAWKATSAQFVLTGKSTRAGDGKLNTEFRLWDLAAGAQIAGQQYTTEASNARRVAHIVADAVFTRVTGEKGFFDSRVVFVDETGSAEKRKKRLAIMDQDGFNTKYLTRGEDLVVTPRFAPSGQEVAYMSFGQDEPKVFVLNFETGQRESVGNFPGMTFAPRFSPDGQRLAMSLSQGAASNLYALNLGSKGQTQLTNTNAIDTSPCYSPDGSQIVFESDRGGTQQIYVMSASGGEARRISFGDGRYSTPVWSPKGDLIAFTRQKSSSFAIGVMKPDGSGERVLTEGFHNEGPTWAPNGLYVMFFRDPGGNAGSKIFMVDIFGRGEFLVPTPSFASDPSWGPLQG